LLANYKAVYLMQIHTGVMHFSNQWNRGIKNPKKGKRNKEEKMNVFYYLYLETAGDSTQYGRNRGFSQTIYSLSI
jgi:hypothetical protein